MQLMQKVDGQIVPQAPFLPMKTKEKGCVSCDEGNPVVTSQNTCQACEDKLIAFSLRFHQN